MENNIVQDFQNLHVFSSHSINRMDELVQDLTNALEETSKGVSRSGGSQETTSSAISRRYHKRRRGTHRTAVNLFWKRGTISEASESSIDEVIRDYIDKSVTHSDSDDLALTHRKHRLTVPMADPVPPIESDSFTENLSPLRPQRRRRRYKHMAVDALHAVDGETSSSTCTAAIYMSDNHSDKLESQRKSMQKVPDLPEQSHIEHQKISQVNQSNSPSGQNAMPGKRKRSSKGRTEYTKLDTKLDGEKHSLDLEMDIANSPQ